MLAREDMQEPLLYLASALSPEWLVAGRNVKVKQAPTDFGPVSYTLDATEEGATLKFEAQWLKAPAGLRFHIPWFVELPSDVREVRFQWTRKGDTELSYRKGSNAMCIAIGKSSAARRSRTLTVDGFSQSDGRFFRCQTSGRRHRPSRGECSLFR
jgi:hypothetical protein